MSGGGGDGGGVTKMLGCFAAIFVSTKQGSLSQIMISSEP